MADDDGRGEVRYLDELREPGEGWRQQHRFLTVIERINDENDRLVKLLRMMRMAVQPGLPISEDTWDFVLMAVERMLDMEEHFAQKDADQE